MISDLLIEYGIPLVTWLLGILGVGVSFLIRQFWKNARLLEALTRVGRAVSDAVNEVFQAYVSELKRAKADGTLTPDERAQAKDIAVKRAKDFLGKKGIRVLLAALGMKADALDSFLGGQVESEIRRQKLEIEKAAAQGGLIARIAQAAKVAPPVPPRGA